jgi:hypothetical protein
LDCKSCHQQGLASELVDGKGVQQYYEQLKNTLDPIYSQRLRPRVPSQAFVNQHCIHREGCIASVSEVQRLQIRKSRTYPQYRPPAAGRRHRTHKPAFFAWLPISEARCIPGWHASIDIPWTAPIHGTQLEYARFLASQSGASQAF